MASKKQVVFLVAVLALTLFLVSSVSASGTISQVEVSGVDATNGANIATFSGDTIPVRITFSSDENASDVRVKAWISGNADLSASSERFDLIANSAYSRLLAVQVPSNIDPLAENVELNILVESLSGEIATKTVNLGVQRPSYVVDVLDVNMDPQVMAGDTLSLDVVLKNRGSHLAQDNFVRVTVPALGLEERNYFGDLSSMDQSHPEMTDSVERLVNVKIPSSAPAGVYDVVIEAYNGDALTTLTKKVAVTGAGENSMVVSSSSSKSFAVGESQVYNLLLVNSGNKVTVYDLVFDTPANLNVDVPDTVVAIPAGSSKTVPMTVSGTQAGKYNFIVKVNSDGNLVKSESFIANVEGSSAFTGSATLVLTIILAIVFVVLLVVLIVLLTRKPEKTEEFGESYY